MSDVIHTGPNRRFRFTNNNDLKIEEEQRAEVGTVWRVVGALSDDELRQLYAELEKRDYDREWDPRNE